MRSMVVGSTTNEPRLTMNDMEALMGTKGKKWLAVLAGVLVLLYLILWKLILPAGLERAIPLVENAAGEYINGQLQMETMEVGPDLTFTARNLRLADQGGKLVAEVPALSLHLDPLKLLTGSGTLGMVSRITLEGPRLFLVQDERQEWNVAHLLKESQSSSTDFKALIAIRDGRVKLQLPYGTWEAEVEGTIDSAQNPDFALDLMVTRKNQSIHVAGTLNTDRQGTLTAQTDFMGLQDFSPLGEQFLPITDLTGALTDASITWTNNAAGSQLSGRVQLRQVGAVYSWNGHDLALGADGGLSFDQMRLKARDLEVTMDGQKVRVSGGVDLTDLQDPRAEKLQADLDSFDLSALPLDLPVTGRISGTLALDGTKEDLTGSGTFTSPSLTFQDYEAEQVTLPFSFRNHRVETDGAKASLGGGSVTVQASYDWEDQEGQAALTLDQVDGGIFVPRLGSLVLDGTLYAAGQYQDGILRLETLSSDLSLAWGNLKLQQIALDGSLDGSRITLSRISGYTEEGGALAGSGSLTDGQLQGNLYVTGLPVDPLLAAVGQEGKGNLSGHLVLGGTADDPQAFGAFSFENGELLGQTIQEAHGALEWKERKAGFHKVEVNLDQGTHILDGQVDLSGSEPQLDLTLETRGIRLEPLSEAFQSPWPVTGNLTNTITVKGPLSNPSFTGHVHAWDGSVNKFLVDEVDGDYTYDGKILQLKNFRAQALTCSAQFSGTVSRDGFLDIGIDAKNINLLRLPWLKDSVDLAGNVNFSGSITGHTSRPQFQGVLSSDSVLINGVEFTGLALSFQSQAGHVNTFQGTFQQKTGGNYALKARFDFDRKLFQWTVDVTRGNVRSLLQMGGIKADVDGYLSGRIEANPDGPRTGMTIIGKVEDGKVAGVPFASADFDIYTHLGQWKIRKLQAQENGGGLIAAQGNFNLKERTIDLELATSEANAKLLTVGMDNPPEVSGKLNIVAQLKGKLDDPNGNFSLEMKEGSISGMAFDSLYGMVTLRNDMFHLDQFLIQRDVYKVSAYGTFPMDLLRPVAKRKDPKSRMNLEVRLDNGNLAILPTLTKWVQWADGPTSGRVDITGTLEDYNLDGSIDLDGGTVKFRGLDNTFDNVKFHADFNGKTITLKEFSAATGKNGSITASGSYLLNDVSGKPYHLDLAIKDVELVSSSVKGKLNGTFGLEHRDSKPFLTGNLKLDKGYLGISAIPEFGEGGADIGLDVDVDLGNNLHLYNAAFMDLWLKGQFHILGSTAFPQINGSIRVNRGSRLKYLGTPFNIGFGEIYWPRPGTFVPNVNMSAFTHLGQYNIMAKASGPLSLDDIVIKLSSDPPQDENTLKRFLTLKTDDASLGDEAWRGLVDAGLQMTFLADVEDAIKDALGLDELRIYSGTVQNTIAFSADPDRANEATGQDRRQYNVLLSRYFGRKLLIGYTTSFDGEKSNLYAGYRIAPRVHIGISTDQDNNHWYGVQYRTRF